MGGSESQLLQGLSHTQCVSWGHRKSSPSSQSVLERSQKSIFCLSALTPDMLRLFVRPTRQSVTFSDGSVGICTRPLVLLTEKGEKKCFWKDLSSKCLVGVQLSAKCPHHLCPAALWAAICRSGISLPEARQIPPLSVQVAFSVLCLRYRFDRYREDLSLHQFPCLVKLSVSCYPRLHSLSGAMSHLGLLPASSS